MSDRKCVGCGQFKDKDKLIKITKENVSGDIIINGGNKIVGRTAYLCYNNSCIEAAFKKNKIAKALKTSLPEDLKGKLIDEF